MKAETVKREIPAAAFFAFELPGMKPRHNGAGWIPAGPCPFHDEKPPGGSFRVSMETGAFYCHACGHKGGDILAFLMLRDGLTLPEAVHTLAEQWGVS